MEPHKEKDGKPRIRERGQGLVEYALILILVAVVVILIASFFGDRVQKTYCKAAFSIDPNIDAPFCVALDVSCNIVSNSPFRLEAQVTDNVGENNITNVQFYVDGIPRNNEVHYRYCLIGGDAACDPYTGSKGPHEFAAVAYDADGNTGKCTIKANVP